MDYPRDVIMQKAAEAIATHGGPEHARVFFKFTCAQCGERCTFNEPNMLREEGECFACGHNAPVEQAGFALHISHAGFPPTHP